MADTSLFSFNLPRNYFKHIKRHITCPKWGASKALLNAKINIPASNPEVREQLEILYHPSVPWIEKEYCSILFMDTELIREMPVFYNAIKQHFKAVFEAQQKIELTTSISSIN